MPSQIIILTLVSILLFNVRWRDCMVNVLSDLVGFCVILAAFDDFLRFSPSLVYLS